MAVLNKSTIKILSIISLLLILYSLIVINNTPSATNYEFSIYNSFDYSVWLSIILAIIIGSIIILNDSLSEKNEGLWKLGILIILISNTVLLIIPIARNYIIFGRGDVLTHIGFIKDIISNGTINDNMYPVYHVLVVNIHYFTQIPINYLIIFIPIISYIFFITSMYILYDYLLENDNKKLLVLLFSSLLIFSTYHTIFAPFSQSFLILPFFIYLYFKSRRSNKKIEYSLLTLILAIFITLSHPITTLILISILLVIELSNYLNPKLLKLKKDRSVSSYSLITIIIIIFFSWQSYSYWVVRSISKISGFYSQGIGESQLQSYSSILDYGNPTFFEIANFISYKYGPWIIIGILALVSIIYLFRKKENWDYNHTFNSIGLIFFMMGSILTLVSAQVFGFTRLYIIFIIFALFLVSSFLHVILTKNSSRPKKYVKYALLILIISSITFFSTFNIYNSPLTKTTNEQVTQSELAGMETFFEIRNTTSTDVELGIWPYLFYNAIHGKSYNAQNRSLKYAYTTPLDHFGYNNTTELVESYPYPYTTYFIINDVGKYSYKNLYPDYKDKWRFTDNDFKKLINDPSVKYIYDNGNMEIYSIK